MSIVEAVQEGDRRGALAGTAVVLAAALDGAEDPRHVEALSRELRMVLRELEGLPVGAKPADLEDALAARRAAKQAANG